MKEPVIGTVFSIWLGCFLRPMRAFRSVSLKSLRLLPQKCSDRGQTVEDVGDQAESRRYFENICVAQFKRSKSRNESVSEYSGSSTLLKL